MSKAINQRVIIANPSNAKCDLRGTVVEVVEILPRCRKDRPIAAAKVLSVGKHYTGEIVEPGKLIYLYKGITEKRQMSNRKYYLHDYATGDVIREATCDECLRSVRAATSDGGAGVIEVDGKSCYFAE